MAESMRVGGLVLCGGRSRRMGQAKAWLPFGPERLLQRVVRVMGQAVEPVVVVAAAGQELPELPAQVTVVHDRRPDCGPLEGLATGLQWLAEQGADAAYASSTDVPFLRPQLVRRVIELLGDADVAVCRINGRYHPLAAVYRTSVRPHMDRLLEQGRLRPVFLFDLVRTRVIETEELRAADPDLASLENVNTPQDYEAALKRLDR